MKKKPKAKKAPKRLPKKKPALLDEDETEEEGPAVEELEDLEDDEEEDDLDPVLESAPEDF